MKNILRKIAVLWCGYGILKLCLTLTPLLFKIATLIKPNYHTSGVNERFNDAWDYTSMEQIVTVWAATLFIGIVVVGGHFLLNNIVKGLFKGDAK